MFAQNVGDLAVESVPHKTVLYKYNDMLEARAKSASEHTGDASRRKISVDGNGQDI